MIRVLQGQTALQTESLSCRTAKRFQRDRRLKTTPIGLDWTSTQSRDIMESGTLIEIQDRCIDRWMYFIVQFIISIDAVQKLHYFKLSTWSMEQSRSDDHVQEITYPSRPEMRASLSFTSLCASERSVFSLDYLFSLAHLIT